jgi:hypothetical protein
METDSLSHICGIFLHNMQKMTKTGRRKGGEGKGEGVGEGVGEGYSKVMI